MQRHRPDLIVPIRDRRQSKRYLTWRNAWIAFGVASVSFLAVTIRSEMEPRGGDGFGRLLQRELPQVEPKPVEVVQEATPPVTDQSSPDPMLVAPAQREHWLYGEQPTTSAGVIEPMPVPTATAVPPGADSDVVIVGGPEGISVVQQTRRRQTLRGGFGRD